MTIKVRIYEDEFKFNTHILVYNVSEDGSARKTLKSNGLMGQVWEDWPQATEPIPTFTLDSELMPLLYQELHRRYGGPPEIDRNTRTDLLREQGRVDRLISALIDIATEPESTPLLPLMPSVELRNP